MQIQILTDTKNMKQSIGLSILKNIFYISGKKF